MRIRFCDEFEGGFGWIVDDEFLRRCSHALVAGAGVWVVDPVDVPGVEERVRDMGEPAGVVRLLDRHERDAPALARRLGVPLHSVPGRLPGAPFELVSVRESPRWREVALWWPERRTLVVADALGTVAYFTAGGEPLGVHPLLRVFPPRQLARFDPEHVLVGHGDGVHGPSAAGDLPAAWAGAALDVLRRRGGRT